MNANNPARLLSHCPLCRTSYKGSEVRLCSELRQGKVYHCTCLSCQHAIVAVVLEASGWSSSVGMVTDLSHMDLQRVEPYRAISDDDCIRFHDWLEKYGTAWCLAFLDKNRVK